VGSSRESVASDVDNEVKSVWCHWCVTRRRWCISSLVNFCTRKA